MLAKKQNNEHAQQRWSGAGVQYYYLIMVLECEWQSGQE